jgi:serine/threonine kinase 32
VGIDKKLKFLSQRPFEGRSHGSLSEAIQRAQPKYYVTNPAVSVSCLRAMAALMEKDRSKRIGATSFEAFTSHPFFAEIDFEALERKQIDPIFTPSSDKTNFDATYDLEELLLEEAPLEARARRQKPRAELREDATAKEIREDELHRIIETMFEPFDYTTVNYEWYDTSPVHEQYFYSRLLFGASTLFAYLRPRSFLFFFLWLVKES